MLALKHAARMADNQCAHGEYIKYEEHLYSG